MFKGFYQLTSGMLSQGRRLDIIANNMTNVSTAGYRSDRYTDSTFGEYITSRVGNQDKSGSTEIGPSSYILAPSQSYINYTQGPLEPTGITLDFAIEGEGFFGVETDDGVLYTRYGSFALDEEGYLCYPGQGRVLDIAGEPLQLMTNGVTGDSAGALFDGQNGYLGQIGVFRFPNNDVLERRGQGFFAGEVQTELATGVSVRQATLERSNVDLMQEMVMMLTSQRAMQSAAQLSKMYDQLMTKATTEVGRL